MKAMTILVLHRDPDVREELASLLRGGGYTTLAADSAGSAAAQLDGEVDLVLVDLEQPEIDRDAMRQALSGPDVGEPDSLEAAERRHLCACAAPYRRKQAPGCPHPGYIPLHTAQQSP